MTKRTKAVPGERAGADWRSRGACVDLDPEIFFPVGDSVAAARQLKLARRTCRDCPVSSECLDWTTRTGPNPGVWGGLTEAERADISA